jgi:ATP-dependent phosphoenolpyruvate carboxykinase
LKPRSTPIIGGKLNDVDTAPLPHFELQVPKAIQGVADDLLHPGWGSKIEYSEELAVLAIKFKENYEKKYKGKMEKI